MKTVNSLSGGKTSSYMATHYPADYEIFSLVRIEDKKCSPPKWLRKKVEDKLGMDFIATAEDDKTLIVMFDLEQKLGREITWVSGKTFDEVNKSGKGKDGLYSLPNMMWRFCTTQMKMEPIFKWWQMAFDGEIVEMRCGYRYDEKERANSFKTSMHAIVGRSKTGNQNKWDDVEWRVGYFPLIHWRINHFHVKEWADKSGLIFPIDSNCVGCFWKSPQQLRKNWEDNPTKMEWFAKEERDRKRTFKKEMSYDQIKTLGLQQDFNFGEGSGCQAGFCTD